VGELAGDLIENPDENLENVHLNSETDAEAELRAFRAAGGRSIFRMRNELADCSWVANRNECPEMYICFAYLLGGRLLVDTTVATLGRNPKALRRLSKATNVKILMGTGFGVAPSHPPWLAAESHESIAAMLKRELEGGSIESDEEGRLCAGFIGRYYTYIHTYIHAYMTYICIRINTCVHIYVYICVCVCVRVCVCVCVCVCVYNI